jgi:hypothetical protein
VNCEMSITQYRMSLSRLGLMDLVGRIRGSRFLGGDEEGDDGGLGIAREGRDLRDGDGN